MIRQLSHVNLSTDCPEALLAFYTEARGLKVQFTLDGDDGEPIGWYLACGNRSFLEIIDRDRAAKKWPDTSRALIKGTRMRHFCFEVDDIERCKADLEARGIGVRALAVGIDHSRQAWVRDPDGNDIELMEYTPASLQLRTAPPSS